MTSPLVNNEYKAWACYWDDDQEWSVLVFAKTRGKAKEMFMNAIGEWEFTAVRTRRQPQYDGATNETLVCMVNSEIPKGYPPFYSEEEYA